MAHKLHQRYYHPETGKRLPGATTITGRHPDGKGAMLAKAVSLTKDGTDHKSLWREKAEIGSCCHDLIQAYIMGTKPPSAEEWPQSVLKPAKKGLKAYKKWEKKYNPVYLASEVQMVYADEGFGGTLDIIAQVDGATRVIDIKTGGWWASAEMQISAYTEMFIHHVARICVDLGVAFIEEEEGVEMLGTPMGLGINCATGDYTVHHLMGSTIDRRWRQFKNLLEGYYLDKEGG